MKIYLPLFLFTLFFSAATAQNIPVDFEEAGNGAEWTWTVFENDTNPALEIIPNPDPTGLNTSASVAQFTALQSGQPFAGCESMHGADIGTFTIDASNAIIRIMVWKSVISDVGIKLVREDNWSLGEIKIANTVVEEWEQIEFDFSTHIGNTYDQIVIFPDFNERASDNVIYFDEIYGEAGTTSTTDLAETAFELFPNPASTTMTIQSDKTFSDYEIYSMNGSLTGSAKTIEVNRIDISNLAGGIYWLKAFNQEEAIVKKFIKN